MFGKLMQVIPQKLPSAKTLGFVLQGMFIALILSNFSSKLLKAEFALQELPVYASTVVKAIIQLLLCLFFAVTAMNLRLKNYLYVFVLPFIFLMGLLADYLWGNAIDLKDRFFYLNKYMFLVLFIYMISHYKASRDLMIPMISMLKKIGVLNLGFILAGILFNLEVFRTYPNTARFGFNGILSLQGTATYFYAFLIALSYFEYVVKKRSLVNLIVYALSALLVGTKALWLFLMLMALLHIFYVQKNWIIKGVVLVAMAMPLFFMKKVTAMIVNFFHFGPELYEKNGLITVLTSFRDLLFIEAKNYVLQSWSFLNYMFGGINYNQYRSEFEIVDIVLFFGVFGVVFYVWLFTRFFIHRKSARLVVLLMGIVLIISFLSGGMFAKILCAMMFCMVFMYIATFKK